MTKLLRLPFVGEERSRILINRGYSLDRIKHVQPQELADVLKVPLYIAYQIVFAANEADVENVPDELIAEETLCPRCGSIITELEYECGSCGYVFKDLNLVEYQSHLNRYVKLFVEISHNPKDIALWKELKSLLEAMGNLEEALDVATKIEFLQAGIDSAKKIQTEKEYTAKPEIEDVPRTKPRFRNGLVDGFPKFQKATSFASHNRLFIFLIVMGIIAGTLFGVFLMQPPYSIDGKFADWSNVPGFHTFDSQIHTLKIGKYAGYMYFYIAGNLNIATGVNIFIDKDGNPHTGYALGQLGAETRIVIKSAKNHLEGHIFSFTTNDSENWNGWHSSGGFDVAGSPSGAEFKIPDSLFSKSSIIQIINGEHRCVPIGLFHPVIVAQSTLGGAAIHSGENAGTLFINNTYPHPIKISLIDLENLGSAKNVNLTAIIHNTHITVQNNRIILPDPITIRTSLTIKLIYNSGGKAGSTFRPLVNEIPGFTLANYAVGDGYYLKNMPSTPKIDGVFYDWAPYRHNAPKSNVPDVYDIVAYAKFLHDNSSYFYLQTRGELAAGTIVPVSGPTAKDSDRDGIPDSMDPYPHDFNNDGIPDSKSYVVVNGNREPDVDGDGIADYPQGPDMWLNTTIPNSPDFPAQFRGRHVSIYIGPPRGTMPVHPYDYMDIFISGEGGYDIGGIKAKYLFRIYGIGGTIKGFQFMSYNNGKFINKSLKFDPHTDLAQGWARIEMKLPLNISGRNVIYRIVSFKNLWRDMAHRPFSKSIAPYIIKPHPTENSTVNESFIAPGIGDNDTGSYAKYLKDKFGAEVNVEELSAWISTLNLTLGSEKMHVFTSKDFVDKNISHFKEEKYAAERLRELIKEHPDRPVYRVELLNESIFREEWMNLTPSTRNWEVIHFTHDLEKYRLKDFGFFHPYKPDWYDSSEIRTIEWLTFKLSQNLSDWKIAFAVAKGIKSLDDERIGPLYLPSNNNLGTQRIGAGDDPVVTLHVVDYYSGESDCNGGNDIYYYVWIGNKFFVSPERDDQNSWSGDDVYTNSSVTGNSVTITIHIYEDDSGLCGGDDDYGYVSFTYDLTTKTWSGGTATPYVVTSGPDGYCDVWFHVQSDSDNNPSNINYGITGAGTYGYIIQAYNGRSNYNDPSDDWSISIDSTLISNHAVIYVGMAPNSGANFNLALYDPNGNLKATSASAGTGAVERIFYQLQSGDAAGTWKARVSINSSADFGDYYIYVWCGYKVRFYAQTDNAGVHTPMHSNNGVNVSYVLEGSTYYVWPNDDYYWTAYVDRGSQYKYALESNLSSDSKGHRWISQSPPSGTVSSSTSITGHYYEQYYLTINTQYDTGYSSGQLYGSAKSYSAPGSGWYDAGCTVTIRVDSPVSSSGQNFEFVSWSGSGTGSYSGTENPASFTIQDITTETANWNSVPEFSSLVWLAPALVLLLLRRRK